MCGGTADHTQVLWSQWWRRSSILSINKIKSVYFSFFFFQVHVNLMSHVLMSFLFPGVVHNTDLNKESDL